jgi:hypothetical protein
LDYNSSAADELGSTTSVPATLLPSCLVDAPQFAYMHGEVPQNAQGRHLFSATPPLAHPTGKRNRVPTKVSHLSFEDQGNKENHGIASHK